MASDDRNTTDEVGNTQDLHSRDQQIAVLNRNIGRLNDNLDRIASPSAAPRFSPGEIVAIIGLLATLIGGGIGAFALSDRIGKVDDRIDKAEARIGGRLDKVDDRLLKLDEDVSRLLGATSKQAPTTEPHK